MAGSTALHRPRGQVAYSPPVAPRPPPGPPRRVLHTRGRGAMPPPAVHRAGEALLGTSLPPARTLPVSHQSPARLAWGTRDDPPRHSRETSPPRCIFQDGVEEESAPTRDQRTRSRLRIRIGRKSRHATHPKPGPSRPPGAGEACCDRGSSPRSPRPPLTLRALGTDTAPRILALARCCVGSPLPQLSSHRGVVCRHAWLGVTRQR